MTGIIIGTTPTITYTFHTVSVSDLTKAILTILENHAFETMYGEE